MPAAGGGGEHGKVPFEDLSFEEFVEHSGQVADVAGVLVLLLGAVLVSALFVVDLARHEPSDSAFLQYRHRLGRAILLGLELLVAADIIRTVAIEPTFRNVGVLAAIVAIRTFLSFSLELEINGRWPWQRQAEAGR